MMRIPLGLFACSAALIVAAWWWLGSAVEMPQSLLTPGQKLHCVSYAPFRSEQNPLDASTRIEPWQIEEDLARLSRITGCIRTYSTEHGLDQIPEIARHQGLKVLQGLWLSSHPEKNRVQIETTIALAKRFPDVIQAVIVGNEVLLRGELAATDLHNIIRRVRAAIDIPVTYADVWEFWLKNRDLASAVDFVTVHILPYWEDFPIPAETAAAHVDSIHRLVVQAFPGKDILIGEVGWPSAGRMRAGALPSPANQARVLTDVLAAAERGHYRVNLIEAFDQPWKRRLEGTVGGHWGLFATGAHEPKFVWGAAVSNHPFWRWQATGGIVLAGLVLAAAFMARGARQPDNLSNLQWSGIALNATVAGILAGLVIEKVPLESLGAGGWIHSLALAAVAIASPVAGAAALARARPAPVFSRSLGRAAERPADPLSLMLGLLLVTLMLLALHSALGLIFDPRYRDFPYAPLTAAMMPYLVLSCFHWRMEGRREAAETIAAAALALSAGYIVFNEGFANWQALWLALAFGCLAFILLRARDAQSS